MVVPFPYPVFPKLALNIGLPLLSFHNDLFLLKPYHKLPVGIYIHPNVIRKQLLITISLAIMETPPIRGKKNTKKKNLTPYLELIIIALLSPLKHIQASCCYFLRYTIICLVSGCPPSLSRHLH